MFALIYNNIISCNQDFSLSFALVKNSNSSLVILIVDSSSIILIVRVASVEAAIETVLSALG